MDEFIWFVLSAMIGFAVLYFVVKAAVKTAILEMRAEDRAKETEQPKEEEQLKEEEPAAPPKE